MLKEKIHFISAINDDGAFYQNFTDYAMAAKSCIEKKGGNGAVFLLDNLRFWEGENKGNTPEGQDFAKKIASPGEIYVQDGFAQAHRNNNATISTITNFAKVKVLGLQFKKELRYLRNVFDNLKMKDRNPFVFIIAGKKIETKPGITSKIDVANNLMDNMRGHDKILVGGAMAYPFIAAKKYLNYIANGKEDLIRNVSRKNIRELVGPSYAN